MMKTREELLAFCQGYLFGSDGDPATDDWVVWGGYDINFTGTEYSGEDMADHDLAVNVYPAGWEGELPEPVHKFIVRQWGVGK